MRTTAATSLEYILILGLMLTMAHWILHMQVPLACSVLLASGAATEAAAAMRLAGHPSAPAQAALARRQPQKCLLTTLMVSTYSVKLDQMVP